MANSRVAQVEANLRAYLATSPDGQSLASALGMVRQPASMVLALDLQRRLRTMCAWRPESQDLTAGRSEMLRDPSVAQRSGGDCDDRVAHAGVVWRALTGRQPVGTVYVPSLARASHVFLLVEVPGGFASIDGAPGAPHQWEGTGELLRWPEVPNG